MTAAAPFRLRSLTTSVYLPNLLFAVGRGAAVPVIALLALDLGASPATAGAIVALRGAGTMAFDLPAGVLIARLGEKRSMILAGLALALISAAIWLRPPLWLYAVLVTLLGATWSVWHIARIAFAAGASTLRQRGRVMALIGGFTRLGLLAGPLLGSLAITGRTLTHAFLLVAVLAAAASASLAAARGVAFTPEPAGQGDRPTLAAVLAEHRHTFATAGWVAVTAQILRSGREVLIPLWGDHLGVAVSTIPLVFAASYAMESLLFYPVGVLMDRRGRKWTAVPCMTLLSLGIAAIPLTGTVASLVVVAMLIGLANGLGAGMNMILGSDLSPLAGRSRFLAVWRLITDAGNVAGPLLISAVTAVFTLAASAVSVGLAGMAGLYVLWRRVPETLTQEES